MIKRFFYKVLLLPVCLCFVMAAAAQSKITASAAANKTRILIGEHLEFKLRVDVPENEAIRFFSIDSIPHFEFLEKQPIDTINTSNGTRLTQIIRLTSFDSGQWVIPSFVLAENIATDSIVVDVSFSPFDPTQPYHDIKDVIDVEAEEKKQWWWYIAGGVILLVVLLYVLLRKKGNPVIKTAETPVDPYKEAMQQLEALTRQKQDNKQFYSSLTDIFRVYVYRRKNILSLQKTTDDLVLQVKNISLNKEQFDRLAQALRLGDFVKFAKYEPAAADNNHSLDAIRQAIMMIEQTTMTAAQQNT